MFAADHLDEIKSRGVLLWGADAEGGCLYVFPDPQKLEQLIGFEAELADAIAAKLGIKAKMVQNQWDQLACAGIAEDIILNGMEITAETQRHMAMSRPYFVYAQQIVIRADSTGLTNLTQLKGHAVGVLSSSVAQKVVEKAGGIEIKIYPGNVESFRDLKAARVDAVVLDLPIAKFYARPDAALKFSGEPFAPGYYGIGVRKEDKTLLAALNKAIEDLYADHTLEKIYRKYDVWDERQEGMKDYQPEVVTEIQ